MDRLRAAIQSQESRVMNIPIKKAGSKPAKTLTPRGNQNPLQTPASPGVRIETQFFLALDLHDTTVMNHDFQRAVS